MQGLQEKSTNKMTRNYHSISLRSGGHARFLFRDLEPMDSCHGAITFMPAGLSYTHQQIDASEITAFSFNCDELADCKPFVFYPRDNRNFLYLFNHLHKTWCEDPVPSTVNIMTASYKILESIINASDIQLVSNSSGALYAAIKYMRQKFSNPKLSIRECADAAGISEIYLRQLFRKEIKISPSRYLSNFRIAFAKNLLASGYYSIMEIAARSGYSGSSYFCRIFRKETGLSPLVFAKLQ
jgi:AraC-like DNA-binding protein